MKILAIDTSSDYLSVAVTDGKKTLARYHRKAAMRHSSLLVPTIARLLKSSRLRMDDIGCIAVGVGPGSFTGLRISAATVKGLSYALKIPIVAIPTFDAIAENAGKFRGTIVPVLDAKKGKVYASIYRSDGRTVKRASKYLLLPADELMKMTQKYDKILFLGNGIELIERSFERSFSSRSQDQTLLRKVWQPRAEMIAKLAVSYIRKKKFTKAADLEPMYLYSRECDITGR